MLHIHTSLDAHTWTRQTTWHWTTVVLHAINFALPPQTPRSNRRQTSSNRRWPFKCRPIVYLNTELATGRPQSF